MERKFIEIDNLHYLVFDDHALVLPVLKNDREKLDSIEIPETIRYEKRIIPVTVIGASAFYNCVNLKSVDLPKSIVEIRHNAFENCVSLESVSIPLGVKEIKHRTFDNCMNLRSVFLHNDIRAIGFSAFRNCEFLERITVPDNIQFIHRTAFDSCDGVKNVVLHVYHFMRGDKANLFSQIVRAGLIADNPMFHGS